MIAIPTTPRTRNNKPAQPAPAKQYEEEAGWGSAFHRPENEPPQPTYTGAGTLDTETLRAIHAAGGEFQISVWPRRARTGTKYLRFHIEPPYQGSEDADLDDDDFQGSTDDNGQQPNQPRGDDLPF